jgi:hypothetical protein
VPLWALVCWIGGTDWRYLAVRLANTDYCRASRGFFLIWDVVGISGDLLQRRRSVDDRVLLGPELPLEELFFLILLSYSTLIVYLLASKYLKGPVTK